MFYSVSMFLFRLRLWLPLRCWIKSTCPLEVWGTSVRLVLSSRWGQTVRFLKARGWVCSSRTYWFVHYWVNFNTFDCFCFLLFINITLKSDLFSFLEHYCPDNLRHWFSEDWSQLSGVYFIHSVHSFSKQALQLFIISTLRRTLSLPYLVLS